MLVAATDAVLGPSGPHVFAAKVAVCSCLGVCLHYAQTLWLAALHGSTVTASSKRTHVGGITRSFGGGSGGGWGAGGYDSGSGGTTSAAATAALAALYCAGLFSNSFIEAEDGLHRFLGASALLSLAALLLLRDPGSSLRAPAPADAAAGQVNFIATAAPTMLGGSSSGSGSGGGGEGGGVRLVGFRLSEASAAALYVSVAAACLRFAAAAQESAAGVGNSTESGFSVARSLLPLPALWFLCCRSAYGVGAEGVIAATGRAGTSKGSSGRRPLAFARRFHGVLLALSFAAIGAYWANEAASGGAPDTAAAAAATTATAVGAKAGAALLGVFPLARLLLPRVTYLLCVLGLAAAALRPALREGKNADASGSSGGVDTDAAAAAAGRGSTAEDDDYFSRVASARVGAYAEALSAAAAAVVSHLVPVVVLLLGPGSPAVVLLVSAACGFVLRGVSLVAGTGVGIPLGAVAVVWSIVGRSFFFLTGHHNQFSRLQYSAAFVGERERDGGSR